jgi:hypothetical protein
LVLIFKKRTRMVGVILGVAIHALLLLAIDVNAERRARVYLDGLQDVLIKNYPPGTDRPE